MLFCQQVNPVLLLYGILEFLHQIRDIIDLFLRGVERALEGIAVPLLGYKTADFRLKTGLKLSFQQIASCIVFPGQSCPGPLSGSVLVFQPLYFFKLLRTVYGLHQLLHIPDGNPVLAHLYLFSKIIIAPKTIIDIKVYHLPLGHIVHFQLFGKL